MKIHKLFYPVLIVVILCVMLLPWNSGGLRVALAACPVTAENWHEVGVNSACVGGISNNGGDSYDPSVAVAPEGTPYVAWHDSSGGGGQREIYVRRRNGSSWVEVGTGSASGGGISRNSGWSEFPSLAIAPDGTPYVTWQDNSSNSTFAEIYVRRWNGSSWEEVGTGSATGGGISNNSGYSSDPSVAIALDGTPYVAWQDHSGGDGEIYVRRWNGSSWEEVGAGSATGSGISNNGGWSGQPSIAIAPDGTPYVTWWDFSGGDDEIYVRRWNGSSWEEVGTGSATGGGISNNSGYSQVPSLAIAPDGTPYVAWHDSSVGGGQWEVYVRRWNGSSWEEVGAGSATGGGISNNSGNSYDPSMAVAPDGIPYVAWDDGSGGGGFEIYVRRWNGSSWEEVGIGSASGGGISDNGGSSGSASVGIASYGMPYVVWQDDNGGNFEIYVRRWEQRGITGKVTDGHGYSLSGVFVGLLKDTEIPYSMTTTTNAEGNYTFTDIPPATIYKVKVILRDGSNATQIHWGTNGLLASAQTQPFSFPAGQTSVTKNIDFGDISLDSAPIPADNLDDLAVMFYHSQQVNSFVRNTLGESGFQPAGSIWGFSPTSDVFYNPAGREVNIDASSSQWNDPNCPMNREWHENFHHLMNITVGMPPFAGGEYNHRGFDNPSSDDSWAEGWAEFWPCVLWDVLGNPNAWLYRFGGIPPSFEDNWQVWDRQGTASLEEFAVASLLWDLYDPREPVDNDNVDLSPSALWQVIGQTKLGNDLTDMRDVYNALWQTTLTNEDGTPVTGIDIDGVFIAHGFYADLNGDHQWNPGEEVGWAGLGYRRNTPKVQNAYIKVNVENEGGNPVQNSSLLVDVHFDNSYYDYSFTVDLSDATGNMVYFSLPPTRTVATAELTVSDGVGRSDPYTVENSTYWDKVIGSTTGYAEEHTFVIHYKIYLPILLKNY